MTTSNLREAATHRALIDTDHGSPYDRGMADSYYRRGRVPHKLVNGLRESLVPNTPEWGEYMDGYHVNESIGNHKDWGNPYV
jgi:hypothetical protein